MTIALIAIALYLAATGWLVASVQRAEGVPRGWLLPANMALLLHGATHYMAWRDTGITDLDFFAALSLAGLGMAILTAVVGASGRMRALGVVVFPLAALGLLGYALHGPARQPEPLDWRLLLHAWLALLAYATLAIAAVLAVFLWLQERALRRREFHRWLRALPPLTELETLLFRTIMAGFVLLGAVLLTGVLFVDVTPGAETNPYRMGTLDDDPAFRTTFTAALASDGSRYDDARWGQALDDYLVAVATSPSAIPRVVTLNQGGLLGAPSRLGTIGDRAVGLGMWVGQNGLRGDSYATEAASARWWGWAAQAPLCFEMSAATGGEVGTMAEVVTARALAPNRRLPARARKPTTPAARVAETAVPKPKLVSKVVATTQPRAGLAWITLSQASSPPDGSQRSSTAETRRRSRT